MEMQKYFGQNLWLIGKLLFLEFSYSLDIFFMVFTHKEWLCVFVLYTIHLL